MPPTVFRINVKSLLLDQLISMDYNIQLEINRNGHTENMKNVR